MMQQQKRHGRMTDLPINLTRNLKISLLKRRSCLRRSLRRRPLDRL